MKTILALFLALAMTGCARLASYIWRKCMYALSGFQINGIGLLFGGEISETRGLSVAGYLGAPPHLPLGEVDSPQPRFIGLGNAHVLLILLVSRISKVANTVVKSVSVYVVYLINRMIAGRIEPSQSVGKVQMLVNSDLNADVCAAEVPGFCSNNYPEGRWLLPSKFAGLWAVFKNFTQTLCGKIGISHAVSPIKKWFGQKPGRVTSTSRLRYFSVGLLPIAMLSGCSTTNDYDAYAKAQGDIARAKSDADTARYQALAKIAESGTDSARIAAVMALALGSGSQSQPVQAVQAPAPSQALQWAGILVPSLTTLASINANMRIGLANADNSARIAESTNSTFLGVASKIQAPVAAAANITTTTNTTTTSTDNHASTVDNHAVSTTATTSNPTTTTTTLSGTGTLGSGAYSTQANPVTTTTTSNPVTTTTTNPATNVPAGVVCGVSVAGAVNCVP